MSIKIFDRNLANFCHEFDYHKKNEKNKQKDEKVCLKIEKISIPYFQRQYRWKEDNWDISLESIYEILRGEYFMGSVILEKAPSDDKDAVPRYEIIDGQQRITTLAIFLKALCDSVGKGQKIKDLIISKISHNYVDNDAFQEVMTKSENEILEYKQKITVKNQNNTSGCTSYTKYDSILYYKEYPKINKEQKISQIIRCYDYFRMCFNDSENKSKIDYVLANWDEFTQNVIFGVILLDGHNQQQIFDTLNSNAVALTQAELLKNHLFRKDEESYKKNWRQFFEEENNYSYWERDLTTGKAQKRKNIDMFLLSLYYSTVPQSKAIRYEDLVDGYKEAKKIEWINEISTKNNKYKDFIQPSIIEKDTNNVLSDVERLNVVIFSLSMTTIIPYLFYLAVNQSDENEIKSICKYLEAYIIRRLICAFGTKSYNSLFIRLIHHECLTLQKLKEKIGYNESNHESDLGMPNEEIFKEQFKQQFSNNNSAKLIIFLLETHLWKNVKKDMETFPVIIRAFNDYQLEHLIPQKPTQWIEFMDGIKEEERKNVIYNIGNMTLLTDKLNKTNSNSPWEIKRNQMKGLVESSKTFALSDNWDTIHVEGRANTLLETALELWGDRAIF